VCGVGEGYRSSWKHWLECVGWGVGVQKFLGAFSRVCGVVGGGVQKFLGALAGVCGVGGGYRDSWGTGWSVWGWWKGTTEHRFLGALATECVVA
jgi:hypothetical protein